RSPVRPRGPQPAACRRVLRDRGLGRRGRHCDRARGGRAGDAALAVAGGVLPGFQRRHAQEQRAGSRGCRDPAACAAAARVERGAARIALHRHDRRRRSRRAHCRSRSRRGGPGARVPLRHLGLGSRDAVPVPPNGARHRCLLAVPGQPGAERPRARGDVRVRQAAWRAGRGVQSRAARARSRRRGPVRSGRRRRHGAGRRGTDHGRRARDRIAPDAAPPGRGAGLGPGAPGARGRERAVKVPHRIARGAALAWHRSRRRVARAVDRASGGSGSRGGKRVLIHEILTLQIVITAAIGALAIASLYWGGQWVLQDNYSRWALQWTDELNELGAPLYLGHDQELMLRLERFIAKYPEIHRVTWYREDGSTLYSIDNASLAGEAASPLSPALLAELAALVGSEHPYLIDSDVLDVRSFTILA